ncbi:MAG: glycosyltransferase [Leptothrix sp. (in: b-proteobacteria)]
MSNLTELHLSHDHYSSDKWSIYLREYDRLFSEYRKNSVNLLEIGVQNGGSLEIWMKYFNNANSITGVDINADCVKLNYTDQRIKLLIGDANTDLIEQRIKKISDKFDIVIDDGSHRSSDIIRSFCRYFPMLDDGGIYIAEDLHCSYWEAFEGGLTEEKSSISFFKHLCDIVNHEHWGLPDSRKEFISKHLNEYQCDISEHSLAKIHSIEFINSICIIKKEITELNILGPRRVSGTLEMIVEGNQKLDGTTNSAPLQLKRPNTKIEFLENELLKEKIFARHQKIELDQKIKILEQELILSKNEIQSIYKSSSWRMTSPYRWIRNTNKSIRIYLATKFKHHESRTPIQDRKPHRDAYSEWLAIEANRVERLKAEASDRLKSMPRLPLISVITPTYNGDPAMLAAMVQSVIEQIYPNWELCICDDASTSDASRKALAQLAEKDNRIKLKFRSENGHISVASNDAIAMCNGDFIALLDHDDELARHALLLIAEAIARDESIDVVYTDEDKIDLHGTRSLPLFKPNMSPALLWTQNYFGHLLCIRRTVFADQHFFTTGMEGSQDHDLALRLAGSNFNIYHLPEVLYHWRTHENSTASNPESKSYAHAAGKRAVGHFLSNRYGTQFSHIDDGNFTFTYSPRFKLDESNRISIIIPTKDKIDLLQSCIESIQNRSTWQNYEIIVINNNSTEKESYAYFENIQTQDSKVKVIDAPIAFNWSILNNSAVKHSSGSILIFLNNDTKVITPDWMERLAELTLLPDVGTVGAMLLFEDRTIQHAGVVVGMGGWADHVYRTQNPINFPSPFIASTTNRNVLANTGACVAISRKRFDDLGQFDEKFEICGSDVELGIRAHQRGYQNIYLATVQLVHFESKTRSPHVPEGDFDQSRLKYAPYRLEGDPFYNKNLNVMATNPSPRHPDQGQQ